MFSVCAIILKKATTLNPAHLPAQKHLRKATTRSGQCQLPPCLYLLCQTPLPQLVGMLCITSQLGEGAAPHVATRRAPSLAPSGSPMPLRLLPWVLSRQRLSHGAPLPAAAQSGTGLLLLADE